MKLTLLRRLLTDQETVGELMLDVSPKKQERLCYTIEPPIKANNEHPKGAIPCGWYRLSVTYSPKFGRELPLLHYVPGFEGIRLHAGNSHRHTAGCVLVGEMTDDPFSSPAPLCGEYRLYNSRLTENRIVELLKQSLKDDEVYLHVANPERGAAELHPNSDGRDRFAQSI